jgi:6-phosphogluconolactonase
MTGYIALGGAKGGIYRCSINKSGNFSISDLIWKCNSPAVFTVHPDKMHLYALSTADDIDPLSDLPRSRIHALRLSDDKKNTTILTEHSAGGTTSYDISMSASGSCFVVSNYRAFGTGGKDKHGSVSQGTLFICKITNDMGVSEATDVVRHEGKSVHPVRQSTSHPHAAVFDKKRAYLLVPDLGVDKIFIYKVNETDAKLVQSHSPFECAPGSGPRLVVFSPDGATLFIINELTNTVSFCSYDPGSGAITALSQSSTLPPDANGGAAGNARISPCGTYLYVANRGHNSIAVLKVDYSKKVLEPVQFVQDAQLAPFDCTISPDGNYLVAPSGELMIVFKIDKPSGFLTKVSVSAPLPGGASPPVFTDELGNAL